MRIDKKTNFGDEKDMFHEIKLLNDDELIKIRISKLSWEELFENKSFLYEKIADLLLDEENLLYYASQRESSKTLADTKKYIKKLIENGTLQLNINEILNTIGWNESADVNNTVFQGDIAEYLMSIFVDRLASPETLISKISLKTNSGMPVYGNDNYYYDYDNEILYFGESKFYSNAKHALKNALKSIKEHDSVDEIMFVKNHSSSFIADNNKKKEKIVEIFDEVSIENVKTKSIIFVMNDDIYSKEDYEKLLLEYFNGLDNVKAETIDLILVFFPILSKDEFLNYFYRRISHE